MNSISIGCYNMTVFAKIRMLSLMQESLDSSAIYFTIRFCDSTTTDITTDHTVQVIDDLVLIHDRNNGRVCKAQRDIHTIMIIGKSKLIRLFKDENIAEFLRGVDAWFKKIRYMELP